LLKIIISPTLNGVLIFSDFHPLRREKEGDENHKMNLLRQPRTIVGPNYIESAKRVIYSDQPVQSYLQFAKHRGKKKSGLSRILFIKIGY